MLSRSLSINVSNEALPEYLQILGIKRENISSFYQDISFLERKENGAFVYPITGDFTHAIDIYLFDRDWPALKQNLAEISSRGALVALPDEDDEDPEISILWRQGQAFKVRIIDEDENENRFIRPL